MLFASCFNRSIKHESNKKKSRWKKVIHRRECAMKRWTERNERYTNMINTFYRAHLATFDFRGNLLHVQQKHSSRSTKKQSVSSKAFPVAYFWDSFCFCFGARENAFNSSRENFITTQVSRIPFCAFGEFINFP